MKKTALLLLLAAVTGNAARAQDTGPAFHEHETYIETDLSPSQLRTLAPTYYIDKITPNADGRLHTRICLSHRQYDDFLSTGLPFSVMRPHKGGVSMAGTCEEMMSDWKRYPTYGAYTAMMDTFQTRFPAICKIDTILAETPGGHSIIAAHISRNLSERGDRPAVFYTSTMHGDEPAGYCLMLRLIDYMLNSYATDDEVRGLIDSVDLWVCPVENPDGVYYSGDDRLGEWPVSTRTNAYGEDLNRSYPEPGGDIAAKSGTVPEADAMIAFGQAHPFTLSANFHGGAELFNYPWDKWTSEENAPADQDWWELVGHAFADTCHRYNATYMTDMYNGVTEGGDWYPAPGSRQDCFTYHLGSREATVELSNRKVVSADELPKYWGYVKRSLLLYIRESLNGLRGTVTDSVTGSPIDAAVFIEGHDRDHSHTRTVMPAGNYHRPLKAGTYAVTYSAPGYHSKTLDITVSDHRSVRQDVALAPYENAVTGHSGDGFKLSPNPTAGILQLEMPDGSCGRLTIEVLDMAGVPVMTRKAGGPPARIDLQGLPSGIYAVRARHGGTTVYTGKIVKN